MRYVPANLLVSLTIVGQSQMAISQQPISKGEWTYKNGRPESVTRGGKVKFLENAIYRFDGAQLVICESAHLDERRPKRFVSGEGDGQYLIVLRRKDTKGKTE